MSINTKALCPELRQIILTDYSIITDDTHKSKCKEVQEALNNKNYSIQVFNDDIQSSHDTLKVFDYYAGKYWTQQYVGVLLHGNQKLVIGSRFDKHEKQYFLNYVFCKAYGLDPRVFQEMNPSCDMEKTWDFLLIIMFLDTLEKAFKKGYYKEYKKNYYNNAKLKGPINVARHIKENMLFSGDIAYSRRENTIDNPINNLILFTLKHINARYNNFAKNRIKEKNSLKDCIDYLSYNLYNKEEDKRSLLKDTQKPVTRHIFHDYEKVRILARLILKNMGLNIFSESSKSVKGVLLNMENLWEKFLEKTFFTDLPEKHAFAIQKTKKILFNGNSFLQKIKPDFLISRDTYPYIVLDAKYKDYPKENDTFKVKHTDIYQVLSYMYAYETQHGGVIFPIQMNEQREEEKRIAAYTLWKTKNMPQFYTIPILVPRLKDNFSNFCDTFDENIKDVQKEFLSKIDVTYPTP